MAQLSADEQWMEWTEENYVREMPRKWELSYLVYSGEHLIGYFLCSARGGLLWLHRFVVGAEFRGKGYGGQIIRELESLADREGFKGIMLKTPFSNRKALAFYNREGFLRLPDAGDFAVFRKLRKNSKFSVAVHQPNYVPWLGYFYKMSLSDSFIFLDNVTFSKGSFVNRNRVCINGSAKWLTMPLSRTLETEIKDAFPASDGWASKHLRTLEVSYRRAPYFKSYFGGLAEILEKHSQSNIAELNSSLLKLIATWLDINCQFYNSSMIETSGSGDDRLVELVKAVTGEVYISGAGGANYQSQATFNRAGIELSYTNFRTEPYQQLSTEFIPGLSVVDALFNVGADGIKRMFSQFASEFG
jgi:GNAT superfamily N-acetyltransferase